MVFPVALQTDSPTLLQVDSTPLGIYSYYRHCSLLLSPNLITVAICILSLSSYSCLFTQEFPERNWSGSIYFLTQIVDIIYT